MATSIVFTDGSGTVTLTNGKPTPADRFNGWTPTPNVVTSESRSLATGQPYPFVFRTDRLVSFSLPGIPNTKQPDVDRLIAWLGAGGVITVNTGDTASRSYASCYLAPGASPSFSLSDPQRLEYTLSLTLLNTAGGVLRCEY